MAGYPFSATFALELVAESVPIRDEIGRPPMLLKGQVVKGCNHFQGRMTNYSEVFKNATGQDLYPGTINLKVPYAVTIREDFRIKGTEIGEPGQDFIFERCRIAGRDAFRIRPCSLQTGLGGHGDDTLEISCSERIPDVYVGAEFELEMFRDGAVLSPANKSSVG